MKAGGVELEHCSADVPLSNRARDRLTVLGPRATPPYSLASLVTMYVVSEVRFLYERERA